MNKRHKQTRTKHWNTWTQRHIHMCSRTNKLPQRKKVLRHTNTTRKTHVEMHWHRHMTYIACPTLCCQSTKCVKFSYTFQTLLCTSSGVCLCAGMCVCLQLEPSCPESKVAGKQTVISLPCSCTLEWYVLALGQCRSLMQRAVWLGEIWQSYASSLQRHVIVTVSVQIQKGYFASVSTATSGEPIIIAWISILLLLPILRLLELLLFSSPTWHIPASLT